MNQTCDGGHGRVCNNSPAESTSPENGWRLSERPIPGRYWLVRWLTPGRNE
uniref:DUF4379 domain-containing protein n=1 Tax=Heterorhabditis bacteriophora TaxID=37862 RepID=A0A1I7WDE8_HETBA